MGSGLPMPGHILLAMVNDFDEAISAAVRAEHRARGWSVEELGARLPKQGELSARTLYRLVAVKPPTDRKKPEWKASYIALTAAALGMPVSELMASAERRLAQMSGKVVPEPGGHAAPPPQGADPRTLITWLLAHPDGDETLHARLSEAEAHSELSGRRLAQLRDTIRTVRREELMNALTALPPSNEQGGKKSG